MNVTLVFRAVGLGLRQLGRSAAAVNSPGLFLAALSFLQSLTRNLKSNISCLVFKAAEQTWQVMNVSQLEMTFCCGRFGSCLLDSVAMQMQK